MGMSMSTKTSDAFDGLVDAETALSRAEGTERDIWEALRNVQDPELPLSIVDLGLVYEVDTVGRRAEITITLTYSGCPAKDIIIGDIKRAVFGIDSIDDISVTTVYAPPWDYDRITERGREQLNEYGIAVPGYDETPDPDCYR